MFQVPSNAEDAGVSVATGGGGANLGGSPVGVPYCTSNIAANSPLLPSQRSSD